GGWLRTARTEAPWSLGQQMQIKKRPLVLPSMSPRQFSRGLRTPLDVLVVVLPDQSIKRDLLRDRAHPWDERDQDEHQREHHHDHPDLRVGVAGVLERCDLVPER